MVDNRITFQVDGTANFQSVYKELAALKQAIAATNAETQNLGKANVRFSQIEQAENTFRQLASSISGVKTEMVNLSAGAEHLSQRLLTNKRSMSEMVSTWRAGSKAMVGDIQTIAEHHAKLNQSLVIPSSVHNGQAMVLTNMKATADQVLVAQKRMQAYNTEMMNMSNRMVNFGKNTQWSGRQLTVGITVPLLAATGALGAMYMDVDKNMRKLLSVYGVGGTAHGAFSNMLPSPQELDKVKQGVADVSRQMAAMYGQTAAQTTAVAADLAAAGYTQQQLLDLTKTVSDAMVLGETDQQTAVKATIAIQNTYRLSTKQTADSLAFFSAAQAATSTTMKDLIDAVPRVGPIMQNLGGTYKDTVALLVAMKEGGVAAGEGANALKNSLQRIVAPTNTAVKQLAQFGINLKEIAHAGTPIQMIEKLQASLQKLDPVARQVAITDLFGKFQAARVTALLDNFNRTGTQSAKVMQMMGLSSQQLMDIQKHQQETLMQSPSMKFQAAIESLKQQLLPIGEKLIELATPVVKAISWLVNAFQNMGPLKYIIAGFAGLSAIAGPIIMFVGLISNLGGQLFKISQQMRMFRQGFVDGGGLSKPITGFWNAFKEGIKGTQNYLQDFDAAEYATKKATDSLTESAVSQKESWDRLTIALAQYRQELERIRAISGSTPLGPDTGPGPLGGGGGIYPRVSPAGPVSPAGIVGEASRPVHVEALNVNLANQRGKLTLDGGGEVEFSHMRPMEQTRQGSNVLNEPGYDTRFNAQGNFGIVPGYLTSGLGQTINNQLGNRGLPVIPTSMNSDQVARHILEELGIPNITDAMVKKAMQELSIENIGSSEAGKIAQMQGLARLQNNPIAMKQFKSLGSKEGATGADVESFFAAQLGPEWETIKQNAAKRVLNLYQRAEQQVDHAVRFQQVAPFQSIQEQLSLTGARFSELLSEEFNYIVQGYSQALKDSLTIASDNVANITEQMKRKTMVKLVNAGAASESMMNPLISAIESLIQQVRTTTNQLTAEAKTATAQVAAMESRGAAQGVIRTPEIVPIPPRVATGGKISGPGGPKDDKIPALLSNGEYVIRADAVGHYGSGFMDAINTRKLKDGGIAHYLLGSPVLKTWNPQRLWGATAGENLLVNDIFGKFGKYTGFRDPVIQAISNSLDLENHEKEYLISQLTNNRNPLNKDKPGIQEKYSSILEREFANGTFRTIPGTDIPVSEDFIGKLMATIHAPRFRTQDSKFISDIDPELKTYEGKRSAKQSFRDASLQGHLESFGLSGKTTEEQIAWFKENVMPDIEKMLLLQYQPEEIDSIVRKLYGQTSNGAAKGYFLQRNTTHSARGGNISGPGGPKDDVIPAMLSNGEYVVNADAVKHYGSSFMDAVNAKRLAMGGEVGHFAEGVDLSGLSDAELQKMAKSGNPSKRGPAEKELNARLQARNNMPVENTVLQETPAYTRLGGQSFRGQYDASMRANAQLAESTNKVAETLNSDAAQIIQYSERMRAAIDDMKMQFTDAKESVKSWVVETRAGIEDSLANRREARMNRSRSAADLGLVAGTPQEGVSQQKWRPAPGGWFGDWSSPYAPTPEEQMAGPGIFSRMKNNAGKAGSWLKNSQALRGQGAMLGGMMASMAGSMAAGNMEQNAGGATAGSQALSYGSTTLGATAMFGPEVFIPATIAAAGFGAAMGNRAEQDRQLTDQMNKSHDAAMGLASQFSSTGEAMQQFGLNMQTVSSIKFGSSTQETEAYAKAIDQLTTAMHDSQDVTTQQLITYLKNATPQEQAAALKNQYLAIIGNKGTTEMAAVNVAALANNAGISANVAKTVVNEMQAKESKIKVSSQQSTALADLIPSAKAASKIYTPSSASYNFDLANSMAAGTNTWYGAIASKVFGNYNDSFNKTQFNIPDVLKAYNYNGSTGMPKGFRIGDMIQFASGKSVSDIYQNQSAKEMLNNQDTNIAGISKLSGVKEGMSAEEITTKISAYLQSIEGLGTTLRGVAQDAQDASDKFDNQFINPINSAIQNLSPSDFKKFSDEFNKNNSMMGQSLDGLAPKYMGILNTLATNVDPSLDGFIEKLSKTGGAVNMTAGTITTALNAISNLSRTGFTFAPGSIQSTLAGAAANPEIAAGLNAQASFLQAGQTAESGFVSDAQSKVAQDQQKKADPYKQQLSDNAAAQKQLSKQYKLDQRAANDAFKAQQKDENAKIKSIQKEIDTRQKLWDEKQKGIEQDKTLRNLQNDIYKARATGSLLDIASAQANYNTELQKQQEINAKDKADAKDKNKIQSMQDEMQRQQEAFDNKMQTMQDAYDAAQTKLQDQNDAIQKAQETATSVVNQSSTQIDDSSTKISAAMKTIDDTFTAHAKDKGWVPWQDASVKEAMGTISTYTGKSVPQVQASLTGVYNSLLEWQKHPFELDGQGKLTDILHPDVQITIDPANGALKFIGNATSFKSLADDLGIKITSTTPGAGPSIATTTVTKADGGHIRGPGTETSDSIPAMLSDGEYVIKASSVKKYGTGFMNAVNTGRLDGGGFAHGGPIRGYATGGHVTKNKKTKPTDGEDFGTGKPMSDNEKEKLKNKKPRNEAAVGSGGSGGGSGAVAGPTGNPGAMTTGDAIAAYAKKFVGVPYVDSATINGEATPSTGWDCSTFVKYVYKQFGMSDVVGYTYSQLDDPKFKFVNHGNEMPGDTLYYMRNGMHHVRIYTGNGQAMGAENPSVGTISTTAFGDGWSSTNYGVNNNNDGSRRRWDGTFTGDLPSANYSGTSGGTAIGPTYATPTWNDLTTVGKKAILASLGFWGGRGTSIPSDLVVGQAKQISGGTTGSTSTGGPAGSGGTPTGNRAIGQQMAAKYGWGSGAQWNALDFIWQHESGWSTSAWDSAQGSAMDPQDPTGTAHLTWGIPQANPGHKMAKFGNDWVTNPATQIAWGLDYIKKGGNTGNIGPTPLDEYNFGMSKGRPGVNDGWGWYANGGHVRGPGGPKEDRIPAMLSNGEYVIQADSVKHYGTGFMDSINKGHYAKGGLIKGYATGGSVSGNNSGSGESWLKQFINSHNVSDAVAHILWAIGMRESGGDPKNISGQDYGVWQINDSHLSDIRKMFGSSATMRDMLDPENNFKYMQHISKNFTDWTPWGLAADGKSFDWSQYPQSWINKYAANSEKEYLSWYNKYSSSSSSTSAKTKTKSEPPPPTETDVEYWQHPRPMTKAQIAAANRAARDARRKAAKQKAHLAHLAHLKHMKNKKGKGKYLDGGLVEDVNLTKEVFHDPSHHYYPKPNYKKNRIAGYDLIKLIWDSGFRGKDIETAYGVALAESDGERKATHPNADGSTDYGLFQLNNPSNKTVGPDGTGQKISYGSRIFDAVYNARMANAILNNPGWKKLYKDSRGKHKGPRPNDTSVWMDWNTYQFNDYLKRLKDTPIDPMWLVSAMFEPKSFKDGGKVSDPSISKGTIHRDYKIPLPQKKTQPKPSTTKPKALDIRQQIANYAAAFAGKVDYSGPAGYGAQHSRAGGDENSAAMPTKSNTWKFKGDHFDHIDGSGDKIYTGGMGGWGCSEFTWRILQHFRKQKGYHNSAELLDIGKPISIKDILPSDLVIYRQGDKGHVQMYIGNGRTVGANGSNNGTTIMKNKTSKGFNYSEPFVGIRRMFADGGHISGPGGPMDDKIPAMLSNGEFVVRAASVSKYGSQMLDAINNGKFDYRVSKPMARGGMVGPKDNNSSSLSNTNIEYNINVNVEGSNATPEQIANVVIKTIKQKERANNTHRNIG
jgi:TP901 family phage tail tape measure protein